MDTRIQQLINSMRPANMHTTHGLIHQISSSRIHIDLSVSANRFTENFLTDPHSVASSGAGMDAPETLPSGSIKAFFDSSKTPNLVVGFCQRTVDR